MTEILDALPADLARDKRSEVGRPGMSVDQVLRASVLKHMNGFSHEELEPHLADSSSCRAFCGFGEHDKPVKRSTLPENIKRINRALMEYASAAGSSRAKSTCRRE